MRLQFMLSEIWIGLRRNASIAISVVLVTAVSMYLLGLGLLAQRQVDTFKGYWYDRVQVTIFMCTADSAEANCNAQEVTEDEKASIRTQLDTMKPLVQTVYFESEQEAFNRFQEQFRNSPLAENVRVGDIPQNYRVQLTDPTKYDVIVSSFEGAPGVGRVQDQQKTLDKLFTVMNFVTVFSIGLAGLMVICAILLMVTTIRQAAFSRRRETGIMRLVGASNFTIRTPFILETLLAALVGVGLAVGLLYASLRLGVSRYVSEAFPDLALIGTGDVLAITPWLVGGIIVVAVSTSWVTLWRYLRV